MTEKFLQNNNLQDEYDIDALIELASLVRALVSEKQYANGLPAILVTLSGSTMLVSEEQYANALFPMVVKLSGSVTLVSE